MGAFEKWAQGLDWNYDPPEEISQGVHEREGYIIQLYEKLYPEEAAEMLKKRWAGINYIPKQIQLKIF